MKTSPFVLSVLSAVRDVDRLEITLPTLDAFRLVWIPNARRFGH